MKLEARSTVFVLVGSEDHGTEDGQRKGQDTKQAEKQGDSSVTGAGMEAKGADISAWSVMTEKKLAKNPGSVELAGRIQKLRKSASILTRDELDEEVKFIIEDVMENVIDAHEWRVVDGMSVEGLDRVDLDAVASTGGYDSEGADSPLSQIHSENDQ
jgi:hypothetical protein